MLAFQLFPYIGNKLTMIFSTLHLAFSCCNKLFTTKNLMKLVEILMLVATCNKMTNFSNVFLHHHTVKPLWLIIRVY